MQSYKLYSKLPNNLVVIFHFFLKNFGKRKCTKHFALKHTPPARLYVFYVSRTFAPAFWFFRFYYLCTLKNILLKRSFNINIWFLAVCFNNPPNKKSIFYYFCSIYYLVYITIFPFAWIIKLCVCDNIQ